MNRLSMLVGLSLSSMALAQGGPCWENSLGTLVSTSDDLVVTGLALGFNFVGPNGVTTTTVDVSTNGFINLQPDTASGCCNGTAALLLAGVARISPYWTDLVGGANVGGVFFNTFPAAPGVPARAVITWANSREFGTTNYQVVQCQMYDNGAFTFLYGPNNMVTSHTTVIGVSQGGGTAVANPIDYSAAVPIGTPYTSTNPTIHEEFAVGTFDLANKMFEFIPLTTGGYLVNQRSGCPPTPTVFTFASFATYGSGCPLPMVVYEVFANGTADLNNTNLMFMPTGAGYLLMNGPANAYVDPTTSATAVQLTLGDDQVSAAQTLPFTFNHSGGSTTQIAVSSNGFIWLNGTSTNSRCCTGNATTFTTDPASIAANWGDLYPPGGGAIYFDSHPSGNVLISWHNVPEYGNAAVTITTQIALMPSGAFEIRTVNAVQGIHQSLTGYSAGGGSSTGVPPGIDLSAAASATTVLSGGAPLVLGALAGDRPLLGQVFDMQVSAIPNGSALGIMVLGFAQVAPGFDLTPFGLPGCFQHVTVDDMFFFGITGPTAVFSAPIPNSSTLAGMQAFVQAATLSPGVNPAGYAVSNGGAAVLGQY